jgi:hypothetical protein
MPTSDGLHSAVGLGACFVTALFGCNAPLLDVSVDLTLLEGVSVERVTLDILKPRALADFDCDDLAFGTLSEAAVAGARVRQVSARAGEQVSFDSIPRAGKTLLLAKGRDGDGSVRFAACAETSPLEQTERVSVTLDPEHWTALLLTSPPIPTEPLPSSTDATVVSPDGEPLPAIEMRWELFDSTGRVADGVVRSDAAGRLTIEAAPTAPGPAVMVVRSRWSERSTTIAGFNAPEPMRVLLPDFASATTTDRTTQTYRTGRVGPQGEPGVVALGSSLTTTPRSRRALYYYWKDGAYRRVQSSERLSAAEALALVSTPQRDRVFTVANRRWVELLPDGTTSDVGAVPRASAVRYIVPIGACTDGQADVRFLLLSAAGVVAVLAPDATPRESTFASAEILRAQAPGRPLASGCLDVAGERVRALVVAKSQEVFVLLERDDEIFELRWADAQPSGIAFVRREGQADALMATRLSKDGIELAIFQVAWPEEGAPQLQLGERAPLVGAALSVAGGDIDGDGQLDLAGLVVTELEQAGKTVAQYQLVLSRQTSAGRLGGIAPLSYALAPTLLIANLDDDARDELVLASADSFQLVDFSP